MKMRKKNRVLGEHARLSYTSERWERDRGRDKDRTRKGYTVERRKIVLRWRVKGGGREGREE